MSMAITPIVGTLAYILDEESDQVFMIRRDARPDDDHFGKVNGLGGKVEKDENILFGIERELLEEAGITILKNELRGVITWTDFGPKKEDWLGFIFLVTEWEGSPKSFNDEGSLEWVPRHKLLDACSKDPVIQGKSELPLWEGDKHFIPLIFDSDPRVFYGVMPYEGETFKGWDYKRL
jgi:8-oxo-dGTP diphosphatase